ncbi:MAG: hypothetical protein Q7V05_00460 [Methanoregula sp.]|nr:hypothetical protein [Methanoregula sp.]
MNREETIRGLIKNIFFYTNVKLTKTAIHKILFKLRTELPEGHQVRNCLPFYWYNYGPFSEVVGSVLDGMRVDDNIVEEEDRNGNTLLSSPTGNSLNNSGIYGEVNEKLRTIVESVNVYRLDSFVDRIYRENAPYEFMPLYKLDFLKNLDDVVFHIDNESSNSQQINRLENVLFDCEASLVEEPLFKNYNQKFSTFTTTMERSFNLIRNGDDASKTAAMGIQMPAEEVWYTFAHGVRILEPAHDPYYNDKIPLWNTDFLNYYSRMVVLVDNFSKTVSDNNLLAHSTQNPPDSKTKTILSSIVNGYLS